MDGGNEQRVVIKVRFKAGLSAPETLVLVQKAYGNEALNRSNVFRWYSWFRDRRELVEDDKRRQSKIDSNWGKHWHIYRLLRGCIVSGKLLKIPLFDHRIASRIFEHPQDCSSSDSERGFGKEKVVCTFCPTLENWAKRRSSLILPRHYCDGWCRQKFF